MREDWAIVEPEGNKRTGGRQPVLKGARLRMGDAVIDCLVLDLSNTGARIGLETVMTFPPEVTLELRSGGMWRATLRWQRGTEAGLQFTRFAGLGAQAAADASRLYDRLRNSAVHDVVQDLATARHFDHPDLQEAATRAAEAVAALETCLRVAAGRP